MNLFIRFCAIGKWAANVRQFCIILKKSFLRFANFSGNAHAAFLF